MALNSGNFRRLLVASLASIALLTVSPGPILAQGAAADAGDLGGLMGRLFGLVKQGYAEIAALDAQLRRVDDQATREELETELAEKMADFHERNAKVLAKIPGVEKARPYLSATLANYEEQIGAMEKQVVELARQAELQIRVSDLRLAMRAEQQSELASASEEGAWEAPRGGAPEAMFVAKRHPPIRRPRVESAEVEASPDAAEDPAPDAAPDAAPDPASEQTPDKTSLMAEARARVAALGKRTAAPAAPATAAEAAPASPAAQAAPDTREAIAAILKRFRTSSSDRQVNLAVNPTPGRISSDLGSPSMPSPAGQAAGKASVKAPKSTEIVFPVALEIRDSNDQPVGRRPVEFVLEATAAPFKANLVDGTAHVQADSLVQLTDDTGIARVDMRLTGPARSVKVVRTVEPQGERTICHLKVVP